MRTPQQVGPVRIMTPLGVGATAVTMLGVLSAGDDELGGRRSGLLKCVKVPRAANAKDPLFLKLFQDEAHLASTLHHPNIVRLEQVGRDPNAGIYLLYAYIEGMDLGALIAATAAARTMIDWPIVTFIGQQIARALEYAHTPQRGGHIERNAIVHRDLCPQNILLGSTEGTAYVIDFGFARSMARAALLASQQHMGRIAYGAPELLGLQPYDCRADLFSLGVVLFEALTGRRPFTARHFQEIPRHIAQVRDRARPRIEELRYEWRPAYGAPVPDGLIRLVRVIDCLLEYDPAQRFQSAAQVADRLGEIALPPSVHRDVAMLVRHHQPEDRRSIRIQTGDTAARHDGTWSSTDPTHLAHYLEQAAERDRVRVTPEIAERLIAAFASARDVSLDDAIIDDALYGVTDPDRPAFDFPIGGEADPMPVIPTTRPGHASPHPDLTPATPSDPTVASFPDARSAVTRIGAAWAEPSDTGPAPGVAAAPPSGGWTHPANPFTAAQYRLPVFDPARNPSTSGLWSRRAKRWLVIAFALATLSLLVIATAQTLWVPLVTGQLGYLVVHRFWTPIFVRGGLAGLALSLVVGSVAAFCLWKARAARVRSA